jgi:hypothetical protein
MPSDKYDPRVKAKKATLTRGQSAAGKRLNTQAYSYKAPKPEPVLSQSNQAYADRMTALANSYLKGGDPQNLAGRQPNLSTPVGGNSPSMGSGGSSGGSGGIPASSTPVGEPAVDPLAQLLGQLPQGPTGIPDVQGAYQALSDKFREVEGRTGGYYDESLAKLKEIYSGANQAPTQGNTDYLQQLQALTQQNQATATNSLQGMKGIRQTFMADMQPATMAKSANTVEEMVGTFNKMKAEQEQQIIAAYMEQMAAEAAASSGGGGRGGGGGGGYGSGGSSGPTSITDAASETGTVTNPQNVAILMELAKTNPKAAAEMQRAMDISYGGPLASLRNSMDTTASAHGNNAGQAAVRVALAKAIPSLFSSAKGRTASKANASVLKAQSSAKDLEALQAAVNGARGFGGVYNNPKVVQQVKTSSSKKTKYQ